MNESRIQSAIRGILYYGVIASLSSLIAGALILVFKTGDAWTSINVTTNGWNGGADLIELGLKSSLTEEIASVLLASGIVILIAIPIARTCFTAMQFALNGDRIFALVSLIILAIVAISFLVVGPIEAGLYKFP